MKKTIILTAVMLLFAFLTIQAQDMILNDPVTARTFNSGKYSEVKGTPYFIDKWMEGSVTIDRGTYKSLLIKYDVHEQELYFLKNEMSYVFTEPVISFTLKPNPADSTSFMRFIKGLSGNGLKENQYVQVLATGKIDLYRSDIKKMSELNEINRGVVLNFTTSTRYYVKKDNTITLIKLNKQELIDLVKDKEAVMQEYINANKISFKKEADMIRLIRHYNTLY